MLAIERKNEILDKLRAEQRVLVSDLAAYYHVTEEIIPPSTIIQKRKKKVSLQ